MSALWHTEPHFGMFTIPIFKKIYNSYIFFMVEVTANPSLFKVWKDFILDA